MNPQPVISPGIVRKCAAWLHFSGFYLMEILKSNLMIARDVLTPRDEANPGILALELPEGMSEWQILLVSNLITMTPGTLTLDLSPDRRTLLLHILYLHDIEQTRRHLLDNYVNRVRYLT